MADARELFLPKLKSVVDAVRRVKRQDCDRTFVGRRLMAYRAPQLPGRQLPQYRWNTILYFKSLHTTNSTMDLHVFFS